jgi:hypothetical protein
MTPQNRQASPASAGVLYVATEQSRFVVEAFHSAESLKHWMPDVHVTLFTDRPEAVQRVGGIFDAVERLPLAPGLRTSWGSGLLGKVRAFARAPYEKSLYLDTDTRVLSPRVAELFDVLDAHEIALSRCEPGESRNQALSERAMFNSGVVAFRRTPRARRLFDAWLELQQAHADAIRDNLMDRFEYVRRLQGWDKVFQLVADQTSLARYFAPDVNHFGVNYLELPRIWNWRRNEIDDAHRGVVVIHHAERFKCDARDRRGTAVHSAR